MKKILLTVAMLLLTASVGYSKNEQFISKLRAPKVTMELFRDVKNDTDKQMIEIAENIYPLRSEIESFVKSVPFGLKEIPSDEKLWWYGEADGIKIPYCITAEAVAYYQGLAEKARNEKWESDIEPSINLNYTASVQQKDSYQNGADALNEVYVVELNLVFGKRFASEGGVGFEKKRIVVISKDGKALKIFGDGETGVWFK